MAAILRSQQQLYELYKQTVQEEQPSLTDFSEGSINDILAGVVSHAVSEAQKIVIDEFRKAFFDSAEGQELEDLAVDHFGDGFKRPASQKAVGIVTFSRPNTDEGDVLIKAGTVVKTVTDANGQTKSFKTLSDVTMTGTSINASIEAVNAGTAGNVDDNTITVIETTLTDPTVTVTNAEETSGGAAEETDSKYRTTIRNLIKALAGGTKEAIIAKAKTVSGVEFAEGIEREQVVKEWDIGTGSTVGELFRIPHPVLYIADANGTANQALIDLVEAEIKKERGAGVKIEVKAAIALSLNWTATIALDPSGPNFAELSSDLTKIKDSMKDYIRGLPIGSDFIPKDADAAILAIWGASGTGDVTTFQTQSPTATIDADENEKLIPGTITVN